MRFFFDNHLPPRLARAIAALMGEEHSAAHLKEKFHGKTEDVTWLRALASEGEWIVLCGDIQITRRPHERKVWQDSRLTTFFLKAGWINLQFWPQAAKLVQWWPDIMETAKRVAPGAGFLVPVNYNGRLQQLPLV